MACACSRVTSSDFIPSTLPIRRPGVIACFVQLAANISPILCAANTQHEPLPNKLATRQKGQVSMPGLPPQATRSAPRGFPFARDRHARLQLVRGAAFVADSMRLALGERPKAHDIFHSPQEAVRYPQSEGPDVRTTVSTRPCPRRSGG